MTKSVDKIFDDPMFKDIHNCEDILSEKLVNPIEATSKREIRQQKKKPANKVVFEHDMQDMETKLSELDNKISQKLNQK